MDLGDKNSVICIFEGADEEPSERASIRTTREKMAQFFSGRRSATVAIEAGTHSRWVQEDLEEYGHAVVVANPRKLRAIYENDSKDDQVDAEMLARIVRMDPKLLRPIQHRGAESQAALAVVRARDALLRARTLLINHVRGSVKGIGARMPSSSGDAFYRHMAALPEARKTALEPVMQSIKVMSAQLKRFDREIESLQSSFPETEKLKEVPGIGSLTALTYVTTLEDPTRFPRSRSVGAYLGLRSKRDKSGGRDPQLRITKAGDTYLRRLLVGSAQRILGPFGEDCDLRRWGLKMLAAGGKNAKNAKKRVVVAVARKLSVLLHRLWVTGEAYEPLRNASKTTPAQTVEERP
jgi:transposase